MANDPIDWARSRKAEFDRAAKATKAREAERESVDKQAGDAARRPDTARHAPKPGMAYQPQGPVRTAVARETFPVERAKEDQYARAQNLKRQVEAEKKALEKSERDKGKEGRER